MVCSLRPQLLQKESEVTSEFPCSAVCPSPTSCHSPSFPCYSPQHGTTHSSHRSKDSCVPSSIRVGTGCSHKAALGATAKSLGSVKPVGNVPLTLKRLFHPLLTLWSINSLNLFSAIHWYLWAAGTCTSAVLHQLNYMIVHFSFNISRRRILLGSILCWIGQWWHLI